MSDLATGLITVVVSVLLSGAFTMYQSRIVSRKSDLTRRLLEIERKAESFRNIGVQYWRIDLNQEDANDLEREIKRLKKSIGLDITALQHNGCKINKECDIYRAAFVSEVNGTNFDRNTYFEKKPHAADTARIIQINSHYEDFLMELRKSLKII